MSAFASFEQFIRHGGQASIVLSFRAAEPVPGLKQVRLDGPTVDAFEHRLHELAADNWSEISASFARVGIEIDPAARDVSAEIDRFAREFSEQAVAMLDTDDEAAADADIASLADWLARRFAELAMQGHGPLRHEGAGTRQMLIDRVLHGIDPMTGMARDGVTGRPHRAPPISSRITSPEAFFAAESFVRRTRDYHAARDAALFDPAYQRGSFLVVLPLEDVLGPDYLRLVAGVRIAGGGAINADFDRGSLLAVVHHVPGSEPALVTMYPITR